MGKCIHLNFDLQKNGFLFVFLTLKLSIDTIELLNMKLLFGLADIKAFILNNKRFRQEHTFIFT